MLFFQTNYLYLFKGTTLFQLQFPYPTTTWKWSEISHDEDSSKIIFHGIDQISFDFH